MKQSASLATIQLPGRPPRPVDTPPTARHESAFMCAWNGTAALADDEVVWPDRATQRTSRRAGDLVLEGRTVDEARRIAASEPDDVVERATRLVDRSVQMGRDIYGLVENVQRWLQDEEDMLGMIARFARRTDPMSAELGAELKRAVSGRPAESDIRLLLRSAEACIEDDARGCRVRFSNCADTIGRTRLWWFEQKCPRSRVGGFWHMCRVRHEDRVRQRLTAGWLAQHVPPDQRQRELDRVRRMDDQQTEAYVAATERATRLLAAGIHPVRDVDLLEPSVVARPRSTL